MMSAWQPYQLPLTVWPPPPPPPLLQPRKTSEASEANAGNNLEECSALMVSSPGSIEVAAQTVSSSGRRDVGVSTPLRLEWRPRAPAARHRVPRRAARASTPGHEQA